MASVQSKHRDNRQQLFEPPGRVRALGVDSANEYVTFNRKTGHNCGLQHDEVAEVPPVKQRGAWQPAFRQAGELR
jgi:hypothetical protein